MKLSARNQFAGKIRSIKLGVVTAEVELEIPGGTVITSVITKGSAEAMGLKEGMSAIAIIKATEVMIARD